MQSSPGVAGVQFPCHNRPHKDFHVIVRQLTQSSIGQSERMADHSLQKGSYKSARIFKKIVVDEIFHEVIDALLEDSRQILFLDDTSRPCFPRGARRLDGGIP
jgi:hypothetical protein